ncbi:amino acid/amide ABC transporter ATP-binding protein 2, HAAT family (TC 3.A.1.4.-) [Nocardioides terrae]|uniref:Amino acid/amide ABC transporter ATP-binding protein 2, HAAT family (TC 3.A.1.4.-) n=1 Tax=Nocardioides terrae TaxID=574651 RepID=A0A1I1F8A3_9ACTN|nr:ABC transporter ATP-binding protein [Nocardioides terrae]SFB93310.1 amino acid/amide ABC transporter ATP-binding protein 2, HAAT family (TC 3.A.1.4.-) [Nocardioides terrae]
MLEVSDLVVSYGEAAAVRGVSMRVAAGTTVSLIGSNGSGKTTLVKALMGLQRVNAGTIRVAGEDVTRRPAADRPSLGVAVVPEGRRLFPAMTVRDNVLMGVHDRAARRRVRDPLARVFDLFPVLASRQRQLAGTMSGGEQQMVALGRALASEPRLLILDEPSLGLAPVIVDQMFETIGRIAAAGVTVLLAEQNMQRALELSDHGYVLADGLVVMDAPAAELLTSEGVRHAYLGEA